jgi:hypothetical protein|tara:strand:- start:1179 stop:1541 length:363 start_codon:yes stop_codon:yes gene_type:complete
MKEELINYTIDMLEYLKGTNPEASDLHHEIFNTDYYIFGTAHAKEWVEKIGTFKVISEIYDYENDNFGEVTTDFTDPEKVANMYAYIKGKEILNQSETLHELWDEKLDDDDLQDIINDLN